MTSIGQLMGSLAAAIIIGGGIWAWCILAVMVFDSRKNGYWP